MLILDDEATLCETVTTHVSSFFASSAGAGPLD